ncbi:geranylgeranylglyceryl/heptaprenylglyceryl phosphate synthase [Haloplanus sp. GCM10025708]|uniref:geranylgeranylglyceryl/heptaprenylglyceryl phosphate synthase n=1 Tax=Haloferacaceae TaxID=1644056 RepID=UPI003621CE8C
MSGTTPRALGRAVAAAETAVRTLLRVDTNPVPRWRHVTKVDPELDRRLPLLYPLYLRHTDAVSVGGSSDVTAANTEATFGALDWTPVPAVHEPSAPAHVTETTRDRAAFVAIPEVVNGTVESLVGTLGRGIEHVREELVPGLLDRKLPWWTPAVVRERLAEFATTWFLRDAVFEAYVIQNAESAAAREAGVTEADRLDPREAKRRAMAADRRLGSEILYLEYSGTFGGEEATAVLDAVSDAVSWPRVWYGGGLDSAARVDAVLDAGADAVVVGNAFHDVATEERTLCRRAADALPTDASRDRIRRWLGGERDVSATAAARYLSTVPTVTDPAARAREILVATVATWLRVLRLRESLPADADAAAVRRAVDAERPLPADADLRPVLGDDADAFATTLTAAALGASVDVPVDTSIPAAHLSVAGEPRNDPPARSR